MKSHGNTKLYHDSYDGYLEDDDMATCKECLHHDACLRKEKIIIEGINRAFQYASEITNEKTEVGCSKRESICELYEDRSCFVELQCDRNEHSKFKKAIKMLCNDYSNAKITSYVQKPFSYSLFQVWKYFNSIEVPKTSDDQYKS